MDLQQIASHGLFDLEIEAEGDTWIDDHHTNEDLGMLHHHDILACLDRSCSYALCLSAVTAE